MINFKQENPLDAFTPDQQIAIEKLSLVIDVPIGYICTLLTHLGAQRNHETFKQAMEQNEMFEKLKKSFDERERLKRQQKSKSIPKQPPIRLGSYRYNPNPKKFNKIKKNGPQ